MSGLGVFSFKMLCLIQFEKDKGTGPWIRRNLRTLHALLIDHIIADEMQHRLLLIFSKRIKDRVAVYFQKPRDLDTNRWGSSLLAIMNLARNHSVSRTLIIERQLT